MDEFQRIEFKTVDGTTLRGNFFKANRENAPIVIMTAGLSLLKEHFTQSFTREFVKAGYSCLAFDPRGFGSSEGLPRQEIDLLDQAENYVDAVTAAQKLPGVDPEKIAIWGIGHGGSTVMIAGAIDPRVKAVISHASFFSGSLDSQTYPEGALASALAEREKLALNGGMGEREYVQLWPSSMENAQGQGWQSWMKGEAAWFLSSGAKALSDAAGTPWENKMTLQSYYLIEKCEAYWYLEKVKQPYLHVVHEDDPFAPSVDKQREAFKRVGKNGEFVAMPPNPGQDFTTFFDPAIKIEVDFLKRVLG